MLSDLTLAFACATVAVLLFIIFYVLNAAWEAFADWLVDWLFPTK